MTNRFFVLFLICLLSLGSICFAESPLKFDRMPLDNIKKEDIIKDYGNSHFGIDIQAAEGTPVCAPVSGKVYWTYSGGNHGTSIGLEHESGIRLTFLHLSERLVKKGEQVSSGQEIGRVGMTGTGRDSEPAHLHFAVIVDAEAPVTQPEVRYANPLDFWPSVLVEEEDPVTNPEADPSEQPSTKPIVKQEPESETHPVEVEPANQPVIEQVPELTPKPVIMPTPDTATRLLGKIIVKLKPDNIESSIKEKITREHIKSANTIRHPVNIETKIPENDLNISAMQKKAEILKAQHQFKNQINSNTANINEKVLKKYKFGLLRTVMLALLALSIVIYYIINRVENKSTTSRLLEPSLKM